MLGDRYANLLYTKHVRLVICASERSLLPVFVEEEPATLRSEFAKQCHQLWERIGVETACIDRELHEMSQVVFGATSSRRVLGSLNELAFLSRESIKEPVKVDLIDLAVSLNGSDGLETVSHATTAVGNARLADAKSRGNRRESLFSSIREEDPKVAVVVISAHPKGIERSAYMRKGAMAYFEKPRTLTL